MTQYTTNDSPKLCECGCGQPTSIATKNIRSRGQVKGQPVRFIKGHRPSQPPPGVSPNPSGLCMCGCGQKTSIAKDTKPSKRMARGQAMRYLPGHQPKSKSPAENRFWSKVDKRGPDECWEWQAGKTAAGYGVLVMPSECRWHNVGAHRFSYELHNGPIPEGMFVCHSCDNPPCVNPAHLWIGTHLDNMRDCAEKDRTGSYEHYKGEAHGWHKLTNDDIREIRKLRASGVKEREVAKRFGVCRNTIGNIISGRSWSHVD